MVVQISPRVALVADIAHRLTLGRLFYLTWYVPIAFLTRSLRERPINLWLAFLGRRKMQRAAVKLKPLASANVGAMPIYFLSGDRFWYQTVFCAYSLCVHARQSFRFIVIDDGTLRSEHAAEFHRNFPELQIRWATDIEDILDKYLPVEKFPVLRGRRQVYKHLRKLTDVHAGSTGWKLVLDSDMLFHHRPDFLFEWMADPDRPCYMLDIENSYGYTIGLMTELAGRPVPSQVNVGLCGLRSEALDWEEIETWCRRLLDREGGHYLQEQALTAMLLAGSPCAIAPMDRYVVNPDRAESERPRAALHHYVAESKAWYFRFGWKHVVQQ
jgi:hypothetical protein